MSENSKIEWTTHTFNPWIGCTKVSPGCAHCYAETRDKRHLIEKVDHWGKGAPRYHTSATAWKQVIRWNAKPWVCDNCGGLSDRHFDHSCTGKAEDACHTSNVTWHRARVFPSQCDWLDAEVRIEWLADFLNRIRITPNLDWLLLTKRPQNFRTRLVAVADAIYDSEDPTLRFWIIDWLNGHPPANVWLGVSVEDQIRANERIPLLLQTPAAVRFLSCEPLLGPVDLGSFYNHWIRLETLPRIDWVIVGGESGPKARPCNIEWVRNLVSQCQRILVPVFVKQLGASVWLDDTPDFERALLKDRKGGDWTEWPEDLRIREFPRSQIANRKSEIAQA
jgi:protein gp37